MSTGIGGANGGSGVRERYWEISRVAESHLTAEVGVKSATEVEVGTIVPSMPAKPQRHANTLLSRGSGAALAV